MDTNKKIKLLDFKLTKNLGASLFGVYKSRFTGNGIDFIKHKDYLYGDPIKNIDWKTASKTDKIQSKVFEDERDLKVLFLIDIGQSMNFTLEKRSKIDIGEEIFYALSLAASLEGDSIGAYLYGNDEAIFIDYSRGLSNIYRTIESISNRKLDTKEDNNKTGEILEQINKRNVKNNLIFILTDDTEVTDDKHLKILSITNEIVFFNIFDRFENNLESISATISLGRNNSSLNIDLGNSILVNEYKELREEKLKAQEDFMKKNNIGYKSFDTAGDTFKNLFLFFNKEKTK